MRKLLRFGAAFLLGAAVGYVAARPKIGPVAPGSAVGFTIDQKKDGANTHTAYTVYRVTRTDRGIVFGTAEPPDRQPVIVTIDDKGQRVAYYGVPKD